MLLAKGVSAQVTLAGKVVSHANNQPIEFASILISESGLWAITDENGQFTINGIDKGMITLTVQCLGYQKLSRSVTLTDNITNLTLKLKADNLMLDEVTVTARRKRDEATTSYTIDRTALDNQQILNVGEIQTLLPGGKSNNPTLMNDDRMALRSSAQEKGNASFGTAIEVDGMRMDNNASIGETAGTSTRSISSSNIESVEVVTGIPSVEYGDLSNGIVKVSTRKGKSPFIVEGKLNQHTRQIALNKGFNLGRNKGVLNTSFEHARSFSNAASPHTAYQRNILSLHYMKSFMQQTSPLTLNIGLTGNVGGYDSKADPDEELEDYSKQRDNAFRGNMEINWLLNKRWLTNLSFHASFSYSDKKAENYSHANSASTQPYIHTTEEGYFIAQSFSSSMTDGIILSHTGYWNVLRYSDSKPLNWNLRLKGELNRHVGSVTSHTMVGSEYTGSRNNGRGTYYDDMRYAPTWREYRYDDLPSLHNLALYAEEKVIIPVSRLSTFELTVGLRNDMTMISGSDYGTVNSFSPRLNNRYIFWRNRHEHWIQDLSIHVGWGKSVKLPSFQVLYPSPSYSDHLAFASPSTDTNTSFYAYHTHPSKAVYNPDLRWQYTLQTDVGLEMNIKGTRISLSAFHHQTRNPYMATSLYTPFAYQYTPPAALEGVAIPLEERIYDIDRKTGLVTVSSQGKDEQQLSGVTRRTYLSNTKYVNASPLNRYGVEWIIDLQQIKALRTSLRFDGNYYYYKGIDDVLFADIPASGMTMSDGQPYQYVGYYRGSSATSASYTANAAVANGSLSKQLNLNTTVTTHIPKIRLVVALRIEASLYNYHRQLSEFEDGCRGIVLTDNSQFAGTPFDGHSKDQYIAVYPDYYSTWEHPDERIPFEEMFLWAKDNAPSLYSDLSKLVVRSNYPYVMNPNRISSYYSANLSITKELGDHISLSFYANNFFNTMRTIHSSQTDLETSLFSSGYVPSYYYGLSLRFKL